MLSNSDRLIRTTARIVAHKSNGSTSVGSGLIVNLCENLKKEGNYVPTIITNKHVISDSISIEYQFLQKNDEGNPIPGNFVKSTSDGSQIIYHSDDSVDLCALPVNPSALDRSYCFPITKKYIYSESELNEFKAIENVKMIGYPTGLVDDVNLSPIVRSGITATPLSINFQNRSEFMIDCACFPGSSGSPVFIFDEGMYVDKGNNVQIGQTRFGVCGFLYSGPIMNAEGKLERINTGIGTDYKIDIKNMIHLGYCIKAHQIDNIENQLYKILS